MGKDIRVNRSPTPKLNELIKLTIGTRSLRQVEEESGISHGLFGKVLNKTQKASVDLLHEEIFSRGWLSSKKLVALKRDNIQALSRACKRRKYAKKGVIIHVEYGWGI